MKSKINALWFVAISGLILLLSILEAQGEEIGMNLPGHNLKPGFELPYDDYSLCEKACNDDPNCKAYTYVKPNTIQGPIPHCFLKSDVPLPEKTDCCVSDVKHTALYRFWNGKDHFYTTHCTGELVTSSGCNKGGYSYEGIAGYVAVAAFVNTVPLYRMFNDATGAHFYTTDAEEKERAKPAYHEEGIEGYIPNKIYKHTILMHRLFNPVNGDHFYTYDEADNSKALHSGWRDEGTIGYIWTSGANPCPQQPDFEPRILSFTQTVVNDDQARLYWSVKSGVCCNGKVMGYETFDIHNSTGSELVWRERNPYSRGDTDYKLIVQCGKNQASQIIKVPIWTGGGKSPTMKTYFFKAVQSSTVTPCFKFTVTALSENEAKQSAQANAANATVTEITEAQFYDPKTCGQ